MSVPTFANLATAGANNATVFNTASISPSANKIIFLGFGCQTNGGGTPAAPTISGGGVSTWTLVDQSIPGAGARGIFVFRALTGGSPGSAAVTITCGELMLRGQWTIVEVTDCVITGTNGADAVQQTKTGGTTTVQTSLSITFDATWNAADNRALAQYFIGGNVTVTAGTNFTVVAQNAATGRCSASVSGRDSDDTVDITWGSGASNMGVIMEIVGAGAAGANPFFTNLDAQFI